ncbi:Metallophosphoesterase 1 [Rhynchospora pubera]|uniref:Metallophosphoesterase 1 n=1 Tax=Rhynchospora pubera TaxID=906938 RepID=A0AAV8D3N9_9POAL|nr:Metallophosphoesterase 1 [Rhynchospora pubera]
MEKKTKRCPAWDDGSRNPCASLGDGPICDLCLSICICIDCMARWVCLLAILIFLLSAFPLHHRITRPSCKLSCGSGSGSAASSSHHLRVMMVADLHLRGSDSTFLDSWFRHPYTSSFFTSSFRSLDPHMLVVLGDISAMGSALSDAQWSSVLHQFYNILGPHFSLPLHILPGDRDMGKCSQLRTNILTLTADHMPALDSAGCSTFQIANVSFVSLNSMALLCENDDLRFGVEKVVERVSVEFQRRAGVQMDRGIDFVEEVEMSADFQWRETGMTSGTGPVVLLHFPLYRPNRITHRAYKNSLCSDIDVGMYELTHTLPANSTEYICRALKPRIVISAHAHRFSDNIHADGTREVTVPAMNWANNEKPGFTFVTFGHNAISVSHCVFAQEWHLLTVYFSLLLSSLAIVFLVNRATFGKN